MARNAQVRLTDEAERSEPTAADLFDPIAFEVRLAEARARRAEALARRRLATGEADAVPHTEHGKSAAAEQAPRPAAPQPPAQAERRTFWSVPALATALFLTGLMGGALAIVLLPQGVRERFTATLDIGDVAPASAAPGASVDPAASRESPPPAAPAPTALASVEPETSPKPMAGADTASKPASADPAYPPPSPVAEAPEFAAPAAPAPMPELPEAAGPTPARAQPAMASPTAESAPPGAMLQLAALPDSDPPSVQDPTPKANSLAAARVLVNYPPSAAGDAEAATDALRGAGVQSAAASRSQVSVSRTNVRFFHAADRAAAEEVVAIIGRTSGGTAPEARDFTGFSPRPPAGTLEVWLAGETPAPVASRTRPAPDEPPRSTPQAGIADEARTRMQREVEGLLRQRLESMRSR